MSRSSTSAMMTSGFIRTTLAETLTRSLSDRRKTVLFRTFKSFQTDDLSPCGWSLHRTRQTVGVEQVARSPIMSFPFEGPGGRTFSLAEMTDEAAILIFLRYVG